MRKGRWVLRDKAADCKHSVGINMEDWPRDCELMLVQMIHSLQEDLFGDAGGCGRGAGRAREAWGEVQAALASR